MSTRVSVLRRQVACARQRLAEAIEADLDVAELEVLEKRVQLLERMLPRSRRRRSLAWSAVAVALIVLATVVLRYGLRLRRADAVLTASTSAFTFVNGPHQALLNPVGIAASEISSTQPELKRWCVKGGGERNPRCETVQSLRLNSLLANPNAVATLRSAGSCFELMVSEGVVEANVTAFAPTLPDAAVEYPIPKKAHLKLMPGRSIRVCAEGEAMVQLEAIPSITVGDQGDRGVSERQVYPSLLVGTLFLPDTDQTIELRRTDVPRLGGLNNAALVARLHDPIELTMLGSASAITLDRRRDSSAMPSCLEWLRNNPAVQGTFAVIAAVIFGAFALRQRLLDEML